MPQLPTRKLGKHGPEVTSMGLGLMGLSIAYGSAGNDEERFKVLDRAHELGERNWDSADVYGDSEDLIGKWFKRTGKRDEVWAKVTTKSVASDRMFMLIHARFFSRPNSPSKWIWRQGR